LPSNPTLAKKNHNHISTMGRPKRTVLAEATTASSPPPSLAASHAIARIIKADGNSLFKVALPGAKPGEQLLVELPGKLRNTFWLRRGGFVVVDTQAFAERENKLDGEIVTVILEERAWRKMGYW
jgi:probable RNA-binding protein EIF1AD